MGYDRNIKIWHYIYTKNYIRRLWASWWVNVQNRLEIDLDDRLTGVYEYGEDGMEVVGDRSGLVLENIDLKLK